MVDNVSYGLDLLNFLFWQGAVEFILQGHE
jgi:hypothetical protein